VESQGEELSYQTCFRRFLKGARVFAADSLKKRKKKKYYKDQGAQAISDMHC